MASSPRPPPRKKRPARKSRPKLPALLLPLGLTMADPAAELMTEAGSDVIKDNDVVKDIKRSKSMDASALRRREPEGASNTAENSEVKRRSMEVKPPRSPSFAALRPRSANLRRKKSAPVKKAPSKEDVRRNSVSGADIADIAMKKGAEVKELLRNSFRIKANRTPKASKAKLERQRSNSIGGDSPVAKWLEECSQHSQPMETVSETEPLGAVSSTSSTEAARRREKFSRQNSTPKSSFDDPIEIDGFTEAADLEDLAIALNMSAHLPKEKATKVVENAKKHTQLKINLQPPIPVSAPASAPTSPTAKAVNKTVFNLSRESPRRSLTLSLQSQSSLTEEGTNNSSSLLLPGTPSQQTPPASPTNKTPPMANNTMLQHLQRRPSSPRPTECPAPSSQNQAQVQQSTQELSSISNTTPSNTSAAAAAIAASPSLDHAPEPSSSSPQINTPSTQPKPSGSTTLSSETIVSKAVIKLNTSQELQASKEKVRKMSMFDETNSCAPSKSSKGHADDEDNLFECGICTEALVIPKSLPCLHNFCLQCLEKYFSTNNIQDGQEFQCPTCRAKATVPENGGAMKFPTNFHIENLRKIPKRKNTDVERIVQESLQYLEDREINIIETLSERKRTALAQMGNHREHFVSAIDKYMETMQLAVEDKYALDSTHITKVISTMRRRLEELQKKLREDDKERDTVQQLRFQGQVITNIANELEEIKTKVSKEISKVLQLKKKFLQGDSSGIRLSSQFGRLLDVEMDDAGREIKQNGGQKELMQGIKSWYHNTWVLVMGVLPLLFFGLILRSIFNMVKEL